MPTVYRQWIHKNTKPSSDNVSSISFSQRDIDSLIMAGQAALVIGCMVRDHRINLTIVRAVIAKRSQDLSICKSGPTNSSGTDACVATHAVCRVLDAFLAFQNVAGVLTPNMMSIIVSISEQLKNFVKAEAVSGVSTITNISLSESPSISVVPEAHTCAYALGTLADARDNSALSQMSSPLCTSHPWNRSRSARERKRRRLEKAIREYEEEEEEVER